MKKTVIFSLILALMLSFSACRVKTNPNPSADPSGKDISHSLKPAPDESGEPRDVLSVNNLLLTDNDICSFTAKGLDPDGEIGCVLGVQIKNKTAGALNFYIEDSSLNGFMCNPFWSVTLNGGETLDSEIIWYAADLALNGIGTVRMMELTLEARKDKASDPLFQETLSLFPYGDSVEALSFNSRPSAAGDRVLVDDEDYLFTITRFNAETAFRYAFNVYIENRTDKNLLFTLDKVLVNGQDCDPFWSAELRAGRRANSSVSWLDFGPYGITSVDSLEFMIKVYDADDWVAPPVYMKSVAVTP